MPTMSTNQLLVNMYADLNYYIMMTLEVVKFCSCWSSSLLCTSISLSPSPLQASAVGVTQPLLSLYPSPSLQSSV